MSNSLVWLWREWQEWLAQLRSGLKAFGDAVDSSAQHSPEPNGAPETTCPAWPDPGGAHRSLLPEIATGRVTFIDTDLPPFEPLEVLLDAAWIYLTAQEQFVAKETQAMLQLCERMAAHQRWIQSYERAGNAQPVASPQELNFDHNRNRCYQQELAIYQQVHLLRQQQIDRLNHNRIRVLILLDNLRSELLQINSYCLSVDHQLSSLEQLAMYTRDYRQSRINDVHQCLEAARVQDRRVIDTFNQHLTQLLKTSHPTGST